MLDYRLLVFRTVAEKLNVTRAARELHISQPAVSQHIRLLEEHFGAALFRRSPHGLALTAEGHALFDHAQRVGEMHRAVEGAIRSRSRILSGEVRCGASTTIGQYLLPPLLGRFHQLHPGLQLQLSLGNTEEMVGALLAGKIELAFIEGPSRRPDLATEKFFEDELFCTAAPSHPLAKAGKASKADLAQSEFAMREHGSGTRTVAESALKRFGLNPKKLRVAFVLTKSESIKGVLETGGTLGFLSRLVVRKELAAGTLQIIPVRGLRMARPFHAIYLRGAQPHGGAGAFLAFVKEALAEPTAPGRQKP